MAITTQFTTTESSAILRCDRPDVARRQLEMSIGLVVVLLMATFGAMLAMPPATAPVSDPVAAAAPVTVPVKRDGVIRAQVRVIPIFNEQAADQVPPARRS